MVSSPVQTLKKLRHTQPLSQSKGGAAKRRALVEGVYSLSCSQHLEGKRVLLVDDVITTAAPWMRLAGSSVRRERRRCAVSRRPGDGILFHCRWILPNNGQKAGF